MEIDKIFLILSAFFGFLGALAILTFSANALKLYYHEVKLVKLDKELQERINKKEDSKDNSSDKAQQKQEPIEVS